MNEKISLVLVSLCFFLLILTSCGNNILSELDFDTKIKNINKSSNQTEKVFSNSTLDTQNIVRNVTLITNITKYINNITHINQTTVNVINFFYPRTFTKCPNGAIKSFIKQGESMNPFLYHGDSFMYYQTNIVNIKLGDVVNVKSKQGNYIHAVVGKYIDENGKTYLITQGYSNTYKDSMRVYNEDLLGKYCINM